MSKINGDGASVRQLGRYVIKILVLTVGAVGLLTWVTTVQPASSTEKTAQEASSYSPSRHYRRGELMVFRNHIYRVQQATGPLRQSGNVTRLDPQMFQPVQD